MAVDAHSNFGFGTITTAPSPRDSGTSCNMSAADAASLPAVPFNCVAVPRGVDPLSGTGEIVRVTANASGALTITRAQESTTAKPIDVGWRLYNAATAKVFTDIEAALNPTGTINPYAGRTAPSNWLMCDGSNVSRTTYAALFAIIAPVVGTFTVTIATPAVVTLNGHGFQTGDPVYLTTTGALPTGLVANTLYYVVRVDANSFNLSTTQANAYAGTKIATTGTQSGVHTANACPYGLGDGSTTFGVPDLRGRTPAGNDSMGGTLANRLKLTQTGGVYGNQGASGGEEGHQLTIAELASHTHSGGPYLQGQTNFTPAANTGIGSTNNGTSPANTGGDALHNNVQPSLITNYIIKT